MAIAAQLPSFEIADLRLLRSRHLRTLFQEQQQQWREILHWDYGPSTEMIRRHIDAHSLPGFAALVRGETVGYGFYVFEDHKGLIGDLYVRPAYEGVPGAGKERGIATRLLREILNAIEKSPVVRRIETQLMWFGADPIGQVFTGAGFGAFPRLFMYRHLPGPANFPSAVPHRPVELNEWNDLYFEEMAGLIRSAYEDHVDSAINDQYTSVDGAMRFLKNIVIFPGCGVFQRDTSLVALEPGSRELVGAVLTSQVAPRVSHITQICVRRSLQGRGLGRRLMEGVLRRLDRKGYRGVSLTVTAGNAPAVQLYRDLGFETIKEFTAYARNLTRTGVR